MSHDRRPRPGGLTSQRRNGALVVAVVFTLTACSSSGTASVDTAAIDEAETGTGSTETTQAAGSAESTPGTVGSTVDEVEELFPEVVGVEADLDDDGTWTFRVTLSSPYDTPERYADAWRIEAPDGTVLGIRELAHDHQNEQPFTRSTSGVEIPAELERVLVRGRDQVSGWSPDAVGHELRR